MMYNLRAEYLKLRMKGLPKGYIEVEWESSPIYSISRFNRFTQTILPKNVLFAFRENGQIINKILKDEAAEAKDIGVVDFANYYLESFEGYNIVPTSPILYIFNIGLEQVNNYTIPDKKLYHIIQQNIQENNTVILVSNTMSPTTFKRNYPISSENLTITQQILK